MSDFVPSTYDELFDHYFGYVRGLVAQLGVREADDRAQDIFVRFVDRDVIAMYDPTKMGNNHNGVVKKTNFKAFIRAHVEAYCRHYRERQGIKDQREPVICDKPVGTAGRLWIEIYGEASPDSAIDLIEDSDELREVVAATRMALSDIAPWGVPGQERDLLKLFEIVLPQIVATGKIDRKATAAEYGVSATVVGSMLKDLREHLAFLRPEPRLA